MKYVPTLMVDDSDTGYSQYMSIRKAPAVPQLARTPFNNRDNRAEQQLLPHGVQRQPIVDKIVKSIQKAQRTIIKSLSPSQENSFFDNNGDEQHHARRRSVRPQHPIHYEDIPESLDMVDESGELTGEQYGVERRCDLLTRECKTVLVKRPGIAWRMFSFSILRPLSLLLLIPRLLYVLAQGIISYTILGVKFCAFMLSVYTVSQVAIALLHVMFRMNLGDMDGRYHYMMQIVAYAAKRLAWLPLFLFTYGAWIAGTAYGLDMGPPPTL